jgi:hypothetical protein
MAPLYTGHWGGEYKGMTPVCSKGRQEQLHSGEVNHEGLKEHQESAHHDPRFNAEVARAWRAESSWFGLLDRAYYGSDFKSYVEPRRSSPMFRCAVGPQLLPSASRERQKASHVPSLADAAAGVPKPARRTLDMCIPIHCHLPVWHFRDRQP